MSSYSFIANRIGYRSNAAAVYLHFLSGFTVSSVAALLAWCQRAWASFALAGAVGFLSESIQAKCHLVSLCVVRRSGGCFSVDSLDVG